MQHAGPSSPPPKAEQQAAAAAAASARTRAAGQRGFAGYTPSTHHSLADAHDAAWERDSGAAAPQPPAPAPAAEAGRAEDEAEADAQAAAGAAERNPQEEQDWMTQMVREPEGAPAQDDDGRAAAEEQLQLQRRLEEDAATSAAADAQNAGLEFPSTSSDAMAAVMRLAQAASSYDAADAGAAAERAGEWPSAEQEGMAAGDGTQGEGEQSNKRPLSTSKRAAQNRAAQRAFRERRDKRVKELELRDQLLQPTQEYAAELRLRLAETNSYAHQLREMLLARGVAEEEVPSPPTYPELQAPPLDITEGEAAGSPTGGEAGPSKKRRKSGKTKSPQMQPEYAHHPDDASMLDLAAAATAPHAQHETDGLEWLEQHHPQAHGHMQHQGAGNEEALDSLSAVAVEAAAAAAHAAAHEHAAQDEAQARAEMLEHEAQHGQGEQEMQEPPQLEEPAEHVLEQHAEDDEAAAAQAAGMAAA